MSPSDLLGTRGMPVFVSEYVPAYSPRHHSVQRWWPRVLKHLGEAERGEPTFFVVGGAIQIHPDVFDKVVLQLSHPTPEPRR